MREVQFNLWQLIEDGGLFFFASSLAITSFINHTKTFKSVSHNEIYWSFSIVSIIILCCLLGYLSGINFAETGLSSHFKLTFNFRQNIVQLVSSFLAICYGLFSEKRAEKILQF
jgi:hypothetical protein